MIKWKLMITSVPYVAGIMLLNYLISKIYGFDGIIEFSEISLVLTGGIFLVGFMLAGTMSDFKESEKLPAEIACILEALEETLVTVVVSKPVLDVKQMKASLYELTNAILDWFFERIKQEELFVVLSKLQQTISKIEGAGATSYATRMLSELNNLRRILSRIAVISRTSFIATGYAMLELLIFAIIVLLLISRFKSALAENILIGFVCLIYIYLYRLIKDIDNPFEYSDRTSPGASEVSLFPLEEYKERAAKRL